MAINPGTTAATGVVVAFVQLESLKAQEAVYENALKNCMGNNLLIETQLMATRAAIKAVTQLHDQYIKSALDYV